MCRVGGRVGGGGGSRGGEGVRGEGPGGDQMWPAYPLSMGVVVNGGIKQISKKMMYIAIYCLTLAGFST